MTRDILFFERPQGARKIKIRESSRWSKRTFSVQYLVRHCRVEGWRSVLLPLPTLCVAGSRVDRSIWSSCFKKYGQLRITFYTDGNRNFGQKKYKGRWYLSVAWSKVVLYFTLHKGIYPWWAWSKVIFTSSQLKGIYPWGAWRKQMVN